MPLKIINFLLFSQVSILCWGGSIKIDFEKNQKCIINPFWKDEYTLKGKIKDFEFELKETSKIHLGDEILISGKEKNQVSLPKYVYFSENIFNIEPGARVYDKEGNLVAKMGDEVLYSFDHKYTMGCYLNVVELYCLPDKNSPKKEELNTLHDKYAVKTLFHEVKSKPGFNFFQKRVDLFEKEDNTKKQ